MDGNRQKSEAEDAFNVALIDAQGALYAFLYAKTASRQDALEVLQESNLYILRNRASLRDISQFRPWAKTMADLQFRKWMLKHQRDRLVLSGVENEETAQTRSEPCDALRLEALAECLAKLDGDKRELVRRRYWDEEPLAKIAASMKVSQAVAAMRLMRIRRQLAACVGQRLCPAADVPAQQGEEERAALYEKVWDTASPPETLPGDWSEQSQMMAALWFWRKEFSIDRELGARASLPWRSIAATMAVLLSGAVFAAIVASRPSVPEPVLVQKEEVTEMKTTSFETNSAQTMLTTLALAGTLVAANADASEMCYGLRDANPLYWSSAGNWLDHNNTGSILNRLPTAADDVYIWADILQKNPLVVQEGTDAVANSLSVGHSKGPGKVELLELNGGSLTLAGTFQIGNNTKGAAGGYVTFNSGTVALNGDSYIGNSLSDRNTLVVGQEATVVSKGEFIVGNLAGGSGTVTNRGSFTVQDVFPGGKGAGYFVNEGDFYIKRKFTVGRKSGSYGYFHHKSGTFTKNLSQAVLIGHNGKGVFEVSSPLSLQEGNNVYLSSAEGGEGTLVMNSGGSMEAIAGLYVASRNYSGAGRLLMRGGTITLIPQESGTNLEVGYVDASGETPVQKAFGRIEGFGKIARTDIANTNEGIAVRLGLNGQVVADGGDLDLGLVKSVMAGAQNPDGTNGWFAINGGRLMLPRRHNFYLSTQTTIGDNVYAEPVLCNSFQLYLYKDGERLTDDKYNFAALYAADRTDIPGKLPGGGNGEKVLAVWRLGHFADRGDVGFEPQESVAFDTAQLRFRIDETALADAEWNSASLKLLRWNGSEWTVVGTAKKGDLPYIETASLQPASDDTWNIGWYAIVFLRNRGTVISLI